MRICFKNQGLTMIEKKPEKQVRNRKPNVVRDTMSRQRVEQIQKSAMGEMRRRLYEMGLTSMKDFLE